MTAPRPLPDLSPALESELIDALANVILARLRRIHGTTGVPPRGTDRAEPNLAVGRLEETTR
jgi:hypothetical protein